MLLVGLGKTITVSGVEDIDGILVKDGVKLADDVGDEYEGVGVIITEDSGIRVLLSVTSCELEVGTGCNEAEGVSVVGVTEELTKPVFIKY